MFNFLKVKEINQTLILRSVPVAVIELVSEKKALDHQKFLKEPHFAALIARDDDFVDKFFREKVRLITATAVILVHQADPDNDLLDDVILSIEGLLSVLGIEEADFYGEDLNNRAREYATIRTSHDPGTAGKMIEEKFCKEVFGISVTGLSTDAKYLLYKSLAGLEKRSIQAISKALR